MALLCPNESGALEINSFALETHCTTVLNSYSPLWTIAEYHEAPVEHFGGSHGDHTWAPEIAGREFRMDFIVIGECDPDGVPFDDPWEGYESNVNWLNESFWYPVASNRGLLPARLTMPSGQYRYANVLCRPPTPGTVTVGNNGSCRSGGDVSDGVFAKYTFPIFVPSGLFRPGG